MKLVSFRSGGEVLLGVVEGSSIVVAGGLGGGVPTTMSDLLADWPTGVAALRAALRSADAPETVPLSSVELMAPVPRPGKVAAAGVNYRSHGAEQNREPPDHPVLFAKFASAVIGHGQAIRWSPRLTRAVDFEAELAVVIGRSARCVDASTALDHVAGYTCLNDVSARDLQYSDKQFVRAKSLDTFCPMGPWLVTADEIGDPQRLAVQCLVNGEVMQDASTADMIFGVAALISFCSHAFTLEPGDVIATGTPAGVGWFRDPRRLLGNGDTVEVRIEGIGSLVNACIEEDPS